MGCCWRPRRTGGGFKAQELKADAVILDSAMPLMDGLDAAREIARALPSMPIVLFTMHDPTETTLAAK